MGGYLAYDGANVESEFFAAVAVHAMGIADDYRWILSHATRKTPWPSTSAPRIPEFPGGCAQDPNFLSNG